MSFFVRLMRINFKTLDMLICLTLSTEGLQTKTFWSTWFQGFKPRITSAFAHSSILSYHLFCLFFSRTYKLIFKMNLFLLF